MDPNANARPNAMLTSRKAQEAKLHKERISSWENDPSPPLAIGVGGPLRSVDTSMKRYDKIFKAVESLVNTGDRNSSGHRS
ncbi:hypothetical protein SAMD00023353_6600090 [Rosellinia necatrix]|uniref:Uncharacterized protein n=1 Tax=Rosellinia necatrix TaxID=77044 RepID=A0A1W2TU37_ROSNE|nr:hypothetical protein SAMD00023353_6600090 [Rosellinia necatrix]